MCFVFKQANMVIFFYFVFILPFCQSEKIKWVVAADPQCFRTDHDGFNEEINTNNNNKAVDSILKLNDISFVMINGDLTEYGHGNEFRYFYYNLYKKLTTKFKVLYGLGNHDIENNLGDCQDGLSWSISKDGCAADMWLDMYRKIENEFKSLNLDNFWYRPGEVIFF